ncbi:MAG: NAD(P)/FAD-dependent oxidoreductase [Cytophagales bacterium]|nr:MAG: NAD(P)/FAD-dependent oxidoreductase [Cytophagales bacterium]
MSSKHTLKVCIIGAGSSGIAAAKVLKQHGVAFDCYEKGSAIGGNWRYQNDNGMSSAYLSLHINTSKSMMAYSDFPMPEAYPAFPHHSLILQYFEAYIDHFDIRKYIIFNTGVQEVKRNNDGTYTVITDQGNSETYKAVIVANGHHWNPRYPEPAFKGNFKGEILHSHYYKTPDVLNHKNVLVVGVGNSAVDIACEAARLHTGKVFISTRSGAYILPNYIYGIPFDTLAHPLVSYLPLFFQRIILNIALFLARGRQEAYGMPKPKRPILSEHPTNSQDLLNLVGRGKVNIKPNIAELLGEEVLFEDGTKEKIDIIVYCTGYKITFPFFKDSSFDGLKLEENNDLQLYQRVVHPEFDNLFFLGLVQPLGAIMPLAEVQSEWIAKLLTKEVKLPSKEAMQAAIQKERKKIKERYKDSPRHTIQVDFFPYKHLIQREIKRMKVKS